MKRMTETKLLKLKRDIEDNDLYEYMTVKQRALFEHHVLGISWDDVNYNPIDEDGHHEE